MQRRSLYMTGFFVMYRGQRVILIYFSAKIEMIARLRGHDRFFCHVQRKAIQNHRLSMSGSISNYSSNLPMINKCLYC